MTTKRRTCTARPPLRQLPVRRPGEIYARRMTIADELERARALRFADDETAARDLLVSLMPQIEAADRDDQLLDVFAQLGEIYLVRGAADGVVECIRRIRDCLAIYESIQAGLRPDLAAMVTMSDADVVAMIRRFTLLTRFLDAGLAAAAADHIRARAALTTLLTTEQDPDLVDDFEYCAIIATVSCATALCDDDLYAQAEPLWQSALHRLDSISGRTDVSADRIRVLTGIAYGRFCVLTGRLLTAEPWLRRSGALAQRHSWQLSSARTLLERGAAAWSGGDHDTCERLVGEAYPVIAGHARAHDVSRCWLYFGLTRMAVGALEQADECWGHAETHWRELGKPLYVHRILLQRSWVAVFRSRFADAVELVAQARGWLDAAPERNWLAYARIDDHLGSIWRADALTDLGFDGLGHPDDSFAEVQARQLSALAVTSSEPGSPGYLRAMTKLEQAAELKVPAALAVDSVRYTMTDPDARQRWASSVSGPLLAGAFAVAWEWENAGLLSELVEYHSARGAFVDQQQSHSETGWASTATAPVPVDDVSELALAAGGVNDAAGRTLSRLGPLPPLQMNPGGPPVLARYRELAQTRYGCHVTATEKPWATWP